MSGSSFGKIFKISTWGESHGKALGVVIDGCPSGLKLCEQDIQLYLNRRRPGQSSISTPRKEEDKVEILSGVFEGRTTGTPISLMVFNTAQNSSDYDEIASYYRPGHADYTFTKKYGFRDYRGGGRSSGRETLGRVAAGAIAGKILNELGVELFTFTKSIGPITVDNSNFCREAVLKTPTLMPDFDAAEKALNYLNHCRKEYDSAGGVIECRINNVPAGIGDPVFEKLDANLSKALFSIGAVKAVEIGDGTTAASNVGSKNNDAFTSHNGKIIKKTNHAGGILGGISDGSEIICRVHIKPTPSIYAPQETVNTNGDPITVQVKGRHDPVIVPRAVVVVESMVALTILDAMMMNTSSRLEYLTDFYK